MVAIARPGIHFNDPRPAFTPITSLAANLLMYDATTATGGTKNTSATTAFFTGIAAYGVQDTTDWVIGTYKTIFSHTGSGIVYGMVACTAGGAETTTFEITTDSVLREITVTNANGERAALLAALSNGTEDDYDLAAVFWKNADSGFNAGGTTLQTSTASKLIWPIRQFQSQAVAALRYTQSMLIRMKHSASITNSTATAYSGVIVRKEIAS